jgi:hypothetical protein
VARHENAASMPVERAPRIDVEVPRPIESVAAVADDEAQFIVATKEADVDALAAILGKRQPPLHLVHPSALVQKFALFVVGDAEVPMLDGIDQELRESDDGGLGVGTSVGENGSEAARFFDGAIREVRLVEQLQDLHPSAHAVLEILRSRAIRRRGADDAEQHLGVVRFGEVVVRARPDPFDDFLPPHERALKDDGKNEKAMVALDALQQLHPIHPRHGPVEKDEVEPIGMMIEHVPRFEAIDSELSLESIVRQMRLEQRPVSVVVFNDQDMRPLSHDGVAAMIEQSRSSRRQKLGPVRVGAVHIDRFR